MAKKKKSKVTLPSCEIDKLQQEYNQEIETNPLYSLEVDPKNQYKFTDLQKQFILNIVQYKSLGTAIELCGIDSDDGRQWYQMFEIQQEVRRLNSALYYRQFSSKLLSLDAIGGYLSSLLTDQNVAYADRLDSRDKLRVVDLLLKVNQLKQESFENPSIIMEKDIESEIKNLSVGAIRKLLKESDTSEKDELIEKIGGSDGLTIEESSYLQSLSVTELLQILEKTKGGNNEN